MEFSRIGAYTIEREIAAGASGQVYLGYDDNLGRNVAIKVLDRMLASHFEQRERFIEDARKAAILEHPNIVRIYETGDVDGLPYFTMEFLDGGSLAQKIQLESPISWQKAVIIIRQIIQAIDYAHRNGIVHRDLKPDNIMFDRHSTAKVLDFGIAAGRRIKSIKLTQDGKALGTPEYMAPEQIRGKPEPASDFYAIGAIFYEMLTGQVPFPGDDISEIWNGHLNEPVPAQPMVDAGIPEDMQQLIFALLEKKSESRLSDCKDLIARIDQIESEPATSTAKRTMKKTVVMEADTRPGIQKTVVMEATQKLKKNFIVWVGPIVAVCIITGLVIFKISWRGVVEPSRGGSSGKQWVGETIPEPETVSCNEIIDDFDWNGFPSTGKIEAFKSSRNMLERRNCIDERSAFERNAISLFQATYRKAKDRNDIVAMWKILAEINKLFPAHPDIDVGEIRQGMERVKENAQKAFVKSLNEKDFINACFLLDSVLTKIDISNDKQQFYRAKYDSLKTVSARHVKIDSLFNLIKNYCTNQDTSTVKSLLLELKRIEQPDSKKWLKAKGMVEDVKKELIKKETEKLFSYIDSLVKNMKFEKAIQKCSGFDKYGDVGKKKKKEAEKKISFYRKKTASLKKIKTIEARISNNFQNNRLIDALIVCNELRKIAPESYKKWRSKILAKEKESNMVYISGGNFQMGDQRGIGEVNEEPVHTENVKSFHVDREEVNQKNYQKITGQNPSAVKGDDLPVTNVTWNGASGYCSKLGKRLPSEAEWEYVAKSGGGSYPYGGNKSNPSKTWIGRSSPTTVDTYPQGKYGINHLSGNVAEWCNDFYRENYGTDNYSDNKKVVRGGSFKSSLANTRSSARDARNTNTRYSDVGFRCVK